MSEYPKENEQKWNIPKPGRKAELLYDARNPLVHSLGIDLGRSKYIPKIIKKRLTPEEISELEQGKRRPEFPTINICDNHCDIYIPALYWGVYRSLEKLSQNKHIMEKLDKFLSS